MNITRVSALLAVPVTAAAVLYAAASAAFSWEPGLGWLIQALIHLGELAAVIAFASSGAAGPSRPGRAGLAVAAVGQIVLAVAEVVYPRQPDLGNVLFGIAPVLTGVGLITVGAILIRADRGRWLPLILGVYTIAVLIPAEIATGGPPAPLALASIAVWDVLWLMLALSVLNPVPAPRTRPARVVVR
ncbi:MAG TPA: hypothetical protein VGD91_26330 [Trebonia sp.]